jgi:hypothetical protein
MKNHFHRLAAGATSGPFTLLPFYLIEGHLFHFKNKYGIPRTEPSLRRHWTGILKIEASGTAVKSRDLQTAR